MFGVRWSHTLLAFPFIVFLLLIDSYKQYRIILMPLELMLWPSSNLIASHASSITFLLITSNLMLHLQQLRLTRTLKPLQSLRVFPATLYHSIS